MIATKDIESKNNPSSFQASTSLLAGVLLTYPSCGVETNPKGVARLELLPVTIVSGYSIFQLGL